MKYFVEVGSRTIEVDIDGDRALVGGRTYHAVLSALSGTPLSQLVVDGSALTIAARALGGSRWAFAVRGERYEVDVLDERARHIRSLASGADRKLRTGELRAPMPGLVVRVGVEAGQTVSAGAGVLVLEAMKMENELRTPSGGVVRNVRVRSGQVVERGEVLIEFD